MPVEKLNESYTQRFTQSEMLDLAHMANQGDKGGNSVPEVVRFIVRRWLYGNSMRPADDRQGTNSGYQRLSDS